MKEKFNWSGWSALGWDSQFYYEPYKQLENEIKEFSKEIDSQLNQPGCGFMLAFFYLSSEEIDAFQKHYGYFPYDGYLTLWSKFGSFNYHYETRNKCLEILTKNKWIITSNRDCYKQSGMNPFISLMRNKSLNTILS